ncbi:conserved Plasmodium protein, unknown function [Plasmodium ovale]|uniref:Uncharacterized protein n=1 Tax=Plasmodium ovale TaxID=36330 RepID=A0A1D3KXZ1_PLAOA|nr:conserved Plasmodium protein, unknown function [Plasmodium ovale]
MKVSVGRWGEAPFGKGTTLPHWWKKSIFALCWKKETFSSERAEKVRRSILHFCKSDTDLVRRRKKHETNIKNYVSEYIGGEYGKHKNAIEELIIPSEDKVILSIDVDGLKKYVEKKCEENVKLWYDHDYTTNVKERTELMHILSICGIRLSPAMLHYYILNLTLTLNKLLDIHKDDIIKYESISKKEKHIRINSYYYNKEKVKAPIFLLYKCLSNVLYSLCENGMTNRDVYLTIREDILNNYMDIHDIISKAPSFLNISLLLYFINTWLFVESNRRIKTACFEHLSKYLNSISNDEINISVGDMFYLALTIRLYFFSFSYNEVLNKINDHSKHFLSSILLLPHNAESGECIQNGEHKYFTDFMNMHEKLVEPQEVQLYPFNFSLVSLKNRTIHILESSADYYENDPQTLRAYNCWRYFVAKRENFKLLTLCSKDEYDDLFTDEKRDGILLKYVNKDYVYNFAEKDPLNVQNIMNS